MKVHTLLHLLVCCSYTFAAGSVHTKYLLYTVSPGEGFNLCRDVYIRAANLVRSLRESEDWVLVLPPWPHLYHWASPIDQQWLSWDNFFDLPSMAAYVPSVSFDKFRKIAGSRIDELIHTQPFEDPFEGGQWVEKTQEVGCSSHDNTAWGGPPELRISKVRCMAAQGRTDVMKPHLLHRPNLRSVLVTMFQNLLHTDYGSGAVYWAARKSMVYARLLRDAGDRFMRERFGYSRGQGVGRESPAGGGGPFIAVHLRRRDYLVAHGDVVPSLVGAALQVNRLKSLLNISHVFLATDAPRSEKDQLHHLVDSLVWFEPTLDELQLYKDGGVAIIDQWISAHGRHFVGTGHSTFSFRIREDRQLMGFSQESTFNSLCGSGGESDVVTCEQPAFWPMVGEATPPREDL